MAANSTSAAGHQSSVSPLITFVANFTSATAARKRLADDTCGYVNVMPHQMSSRPGNPIIPSPNFRVKTTCLDVASKLRRVSKGQESERAFSFPAVSGEELGRPLHCMWSDRTRRAFSDIPWIGYFIFVPRTRCVADVSAPV